MSDIFFFEVDFTCRFLPINDKIALINTQIDLLKSKIATYSGKHNEAYRALSDGITGQVESYE